LNAGQLAEWEAYSMIDPVGEWRNDFRFAELASVITNIAIKWAAGKKHVELTDITDFIPQWDVTAPKEVKKQSVEDMKKVFEDIMRVQEKKKKPAPDLKRPPTTLKKDKDGRV